MSDEQSTETGGEVGTGAGEGATGQDTGTAWVTRSTDCPEAPAQAHLPLTSPTQRERDLHHISEAERLMVLAESCDWTTEHEPYRDVAIAAAQAHATIALALRTRPGQEASDE